MEQIIRNWTDLITPKEETRAGFIKLALEKNNLAQPYVERAKVLKSIALKTKSAFELIDNTGIRKALITASGLSDKSLNHLNNDDLNESIKSFIEKYLAPAGKNYVDELVFRYLLIMGDSMGGKMRNIAGYLAERQFVSRLVSAFNIKGINFYWMDFKTKQWFNNKKSALVAGHRIRAIFWDNDKPKNLLINFTIPFVKKNIDFTIIEHSKKIDYTLKTEILSNPDIYIALGELKGGYDPAGADEHWKTANSALDRIRIAFSKLSHTPQTFFIGTAIEKSMAIEIFDQLNSNKISRAVNLTNDNQLTDICLWIISL